MRVCVLAEVKPDAGLVALGQFNCTVCHAASEKQAPWILPKYAPLLEGLEKRVNPDWLRKWLAAPHETMPGTTMPDLLHGLPDAERAKVVDELTHFLLSNGKPEFRRVSPDRVAVCAVPAAWRSTRKACCNGSTGRARCRSRCS